MYLASSAPLTTPAAWRQLGMADPHISKRRGPKPRPVEVRFWEKVAKSDGCWLWTGSRTINGYGRLMCVPTRQKWAFAHRLSWEIANQSQVPVGMYVLHGCDVPLCVNPGHLRIGTPQDNSDDARARNRMPTSDQRRRLGEDNGSAKLTSEQAMELRRRYRSAPRAPAGVRVAYGTVTGLAREFGVSSSMVHQIGRGAKWTHVGGSK